MLVSKDNNFISLSQRYGYPPMVVHLRVGNTSTEALRKLFSKHMSHILAFYK